MSGVTFRGAPIWQRPFDNGAIADWSVNGGCDKAVYFTASGVTFALTDGRAQGAPTPRALLTSWERPAASRAQRWAVKLDFVGANPEAGPAAEDPTPAVISYFKGSREDWKAGLRTYSRLVYADLWPGIDLVYSGTSSKLKYTFVVKPGASPEQIRLAYRGVTELKMTSGGELEVTTPVASFRNEKPYARQEGGGGQAPVAASYAGGWRARIRLSGGGIRPQPGARTGALCPKSAAKTCHNRTDATS